MSYAPDVAKALLINVVAERPLNIVANEIIHNEYIFSMTYALEKNGQGRVQKASQEPIDLLFSERGEIKAFKALCEKIRPGGSVWVDRDGFPEAHNHAQKQFRELLTFSKSPFCVFWRPFD